MADPKYQTLYQRAYRKKKRQITLTLEPREHGIWTQRAEISERTTAREIFAAAEAHRLGERLPSPNDERELRELIRLTRNIANNLNQVAHQSNRFGKLLEERRARQLLFAFEQAATDFIRRRASNEGGE